MNFVIFQLVAYETDDQKSQNELNAAPAHCDSIESIYRQTISHICVHFRM